MQKSIRLIEPKKIEIQQVPRPKVTTPYQVKVQVKATGICGSDIHYYTDGQVGGNRLEKPMTLGHESSGVVIEVGNKVSPNYCKVGDAVSIEPSYPNRYTKEFRSGHYNLEPNMPFAASPPCDGTLCEEFVVDMDYVYRLPPHVKFEQGALIEPLSVAVHAVRLSQVKCGDRAVVIGVGTIGLLVGAVLREFGVNKLVFMSTHDSKKEQSEQFGGTGFINSTKDSYDQEKEGLVDVVFECSGAQKSVENALKCVKNGGTVMQIGMHPSNENVGIPLNEISSREITYKGSFRYYEGDYSLAIDLMSRGCIDVDELITDRFPFEKAADAFAFAVENSAKVGKVIIEH